MPLQDRTTFTTPNGHVVPLQDEAALFPHERTIGVLLAPSDTSWEDIDDFYTEHLHVGLWVEDDVPIVLLDVGERWRVSAVFNAVAYDDAALESLFARTEFEGRDAAPLFLVSRDDTRSLGERTMLLPASITQSIARTAKTQRRTHVNSHAVRESARRIFDRHGLDAMIDSADMIDVETFGG